MAINRLMKMASGSRMWPLPSAVQATTACPATTHPRDVTHDKNEGNMLLRAHRAFDKESISLDIPATQDERYAARNAPCPSTTTALIAGASESEHVDAAAP